MLWLPIGLDSLMTEGDAKIEVADCITPPTHFTAQLNVLN